MASRGHAPAYARRQDVDIVAIADICERRLTIAREELQDVRLYRSAEELIAREGREYSDFVDIATPPVFHAPIAAQAIERGLHVLCEKPLTTSSADARRLIDLAKKSPRFVSLPQLPACSCRQNGPRNPR